MSRDGLLPFLTALCVPAVLINACALFVLSTAQRLSRQLERVRALSAMSAPPEGLLAATARRARLLHRSLSLQYVAICLFVATMIAIAGLHVTGPGAAWLPAALALGGVAALFVSSALLLLESRAAYETIRKETEQALSGGR